MHIRDIEDNLMNLYEQVFVHLDIDHIVEERGDYIVGSTSICHGGNNFGAFVYWKNSGRWHCFSRSCHEKRSRLIGLIECVLDIELSEAVTIAKDIIKNAGNFKKRFIKQAYIPPPDYCDDHKKQKTFKLNSFIENKEWVINRGLNSQLCRNLGIGQYSMPKMANRIIVPIKNIGGEIIGVSGRDMTDTSPMKWRHSKFKKSVNLYNIDKFWLNINRSNIPLVIITEGPFDVLKFMMAGVSQVVGILGCSISSGQVELLKKVGIIDVYMALDNDEAGERAFISNKMKLERELFQVYKLVPEGNDFGEMNAIDINKLVRQKVNY